MSQANPYYSDLIQRFGAITFENITAENDLFVERDLTVDGSFGLGGNLDASGSAALDGSLGLGGNLGVDGDAAVDGSLGLVGNLDVSGDVVVDGSFTVAGGMLVLDTLTAGGNVDMSGFRVVNMLDPVYLSDAATKSYVDEAVGGTGTGAITYIAPTDTTVVDSSPWT
jgi:hypothetical protein